MTDGSSDLLVGIVTTLRGAGRTVESWIAYHFHIGFDRLYLFFDDPNDSSIEYTRKFDPNKVTIIKHDDSLRKQWQSVPLYESLARYIEEEVQARQQLNVCIALQLALKDGLQWILHIDIDELFYVTPPTTLKDHFAWLMANGIGQITYLNYEGVPEHEDIPDYFLNVTLFRKHLQVVPLTAKSYRALEFWRSRTTHKQYFLAYDCGKSACRVLPGVVPKGVHHFRLPANSNLQSRTAVVDPKALDLSSVITCDNAFILHYVVCGFEWYYRKYRILDAFPDSWFGGTLQIQPCFHLDSRDLYLSGDIASMQQHYRQQVMVDDPAEIERQLDAGTCVRLNTPSSIIRTALTNLYAALKLPPWEEPTSSGFNEEALEPPATITTITKSGGPNVVNSLSLEKSWIISMLVTKYVMQQKTEENMH